MTDLCIVCHHNPGVVCEQDRAAIAATLAALPRRLAQLATTVVPTPAAPADRVSAGGSEAAMPARAHVLSLIGPGAGQVEPILHPLTRHAPVHRSVLVRGRDELYRLVDVVDWRTETVLGEDGQPIMVPDDDQVGVVPPHEWLDVQVRAWRRHFGHHVPPRTIKPKRGYAKTGRAARQWLAAVFEPAMLRSSHGPQIFSYLHAIESVGRRYMSASLLGLVGNIPEAERPLDPLADEMERRFGTPLRTLALIWDIKYLLTWLDEACDAGAHLDIGAFAAQLHALDAELGRALGDTPDQQWLGRCPAFIAEPDPDAGDVEIHQYGHDGPITTVPAQYRRRPCGAGLWQDNTAFTAQVQCPRCRWVWDTRGPGGAHTAREIRRVWPIDRRRRYNAVDIERLQTPNCRSCGQQITIDWKHVTGTSDKQRWWQPTATSCPQGCDEARRML